MVLDSERRGDGLRLSSRVQGMCLGGRGARSLVGRRPVPPATRHPEVEASVCLLLLFSLEETRRLTLFDGSYFAEELKGAGDNASC